MGIDNSALASALRRLFSPHLIVNSFIVKIAEALEEHGCQLLVVTVPGLKNSSDEPSRHKPVCIKKAAQTFELLTEAVKGRNLGRDDAVKACVFDGKARHDGGDITEEMDEVVARIERLDLEEQEEINSQPAK